MSEITDKVKKEVERRMKEFGITYDAAWSQVKGLPEFADYFKPARQEQENAATASPENRAAVLAALTELTDEGKSFDEAWAEVKKRPEFKDYFEPIQKAEEAANSRPANTTPAPDANQQRRAAIQAAVGVQMAAGRTYDEAWNIVKGLPEFQKA